ncbi:hypothetical protein Lesp02_32660, partial [Lentzea sp. NBRC 105346]|uniref:NAD-dependent epimerase/dehydratase family protein n=1 Tax=Lentzea sp. NBRC 105346 TaxID=3032205 RepID=UPI0024A5232D
MARVVVSGRSEFLGSHVSEELLRRGARVSTDPEIDGRVDLVLHVLSPASPADYLRRPIATLHTVGLGTTKALDLAYRKGARFVLASAGEIYGDPEQHPQPESYWGNVNPIGPRGAYDEAVRFAEALTFAYLREHGLDIGIARLFNPYGPRMPADSGSLVPTFIGQALREEPITVHGDGRQTRSLCYVDDAVRGLLALADSSHTGPINIGSPVEHTVLELAQLIKKVSGSGSPVEHTTAATDDPRRRCPDITLAERLLHWYP